MSEDSKLIARENGIWGERQAEGILADTFPNIQYVSDLIDYYSESGVPIEVKTCQESIDCYPYPRQGRYTIESAQHEYLLSKEGYYLFLVKAGVFLLRAKLVKASDISFKRQINWRVIHDR